jgi:hypothetical protein
MRLGNDAALHPLIAETGPQTLEEKSVLAGV